MATLSAELRNKLERTCVAARNLGEQAARAALEAMAVHHHEAYGHMGKPEKDLRNKLRARARQDGDVQDAKGQLSIKHLAQECAYEHWHRMLFARFLAENHLLIEPEMGVAVSLEECKEMAKEAGTNLWALAGRYAQTMLPQIFRTDDPVLQVQFAREDQIKLEELLDGLAQDTFMASDGLGWCYQFWQTERKKEVNKAEVPIGADELPPVTQLFTDDYMVDFLLDNTLGAWWAGKVLAANPKLASDAKGEEELRRAVALPGVPWKYLRFIKGKDGKWTPAAGTFEGWPKTAKELKCLDPCMGSGHFVVALLERVVALRVAGERLSEAVAVTAAIRDNLFGLEIDPRCTQIAAFNVALAAWRRVGYCALPAMNLACSGLAPNSREVDWVKLAGKNDKLRQGMQRLYQLFQKAPMLGSLIAPRSLRGDLVEAAFHELQPLLAKVVAGERDESAHEMAVTASGLVKAAGILAGEFALVATNVPYLKGGEHGEELKEFCERVYPESKYDLATVFIERCHKLLSAGGHLAVVTQQYWLFLKYYEGMRESMIRRVQMPFIVRLGPGAFEQISGEVVNVCFQITCRSAPSSTFMMAGLEVDDQPSPHEKSEAMVERSINLVSQSGQLGNPDKRILLSVETNTSAKLSTVSDFGKGSVSGDGPHYIRKFWEVDQLTPGRKPWLNSPSGECEWSGREHFILWGEGDHDPESEIGFALRGERVFGKRGVAIGKAGSLRPTLYSGELFDDNMAVLRPYKESNLAAIWMFSLSSDFEESLRRLDKKMSVTAGTFTKVPFDLEHWLKIAAKRYPDGLPRPSSGDPTQWLFSGHPKGSEQPLQVAVARLLKYRWPRQTGSSFPDCPALGDDGLEKLADADGIVCIPSVRGEEPAADRLRKLLAAAYGKDWRAGMELELIRATGSDAGDLEEWLRNDFFEQHCGLFHQRPFIWHVWDGRKTEQIRALEEEIVTLESRVKDLEMEIAKLYEEHHVSKEKLDFVNECDAIANLLTQYTVKLRKNKIHLLQEKTYEMYKQLSSKSGLIKDLVIDDKTYEITIRDRNGHEIKKSGLAAGEKQIFAVSLLWGLAQTSELKLPIIIDTPLSRLDSTHRDNIINNYFPNAADQVIILSTDTEIDRDYYKALEPHLSGAAHLGFDQRQELTTIKEGYFWEK
jgi:hypothetical protein